MSRIIAGSRKGQRLQTPVGDLTRPTTDRVREAVFSAVLSWAGAVAEPTDEGLRGMSFLDLFAGSGAMALEAASRGADRVTAVEADRRTADLIRTNALHVDLPITVITARAETLTLARLGEPFDVIWIDPPYDVELAELTALTDHLIADGWLVYNGLLVIERGARDPQWQPPAGWDAWTNKHGETIVVYAQPGEE